MPEQIRYRRIYETAAPDDGARILVDRVWPRGIAKDAASWDEWLRDVAPSSDLRRWYGHDPDRFDEFRQRYLDELQQPERESSIQHLRELACQRPLTLLTAARDVDHSQAAVLAGWLATTRES